ncbi:metallophosphoesterase [Clostridium sp.]|uniref:metallophosphoesterase n=1 Tax=Clostridium sp. TaxID=1506 RepID=UPI0039F59253
MGLYAISDLHLSLSSDKPMDVFGEQWNNHHERIRENWIKKISDKDTVLIAGDVSWSMKMEDGLADLEWIHSLPGRKIVSKGNHDYWWGSISKLNNLYEDISFIQNNFFTYGDYAICGTRGWTVPGDKSSSHDIKIYNREQIRLKISLDKAISSGHNKIIVMIHYPPVNDKFEPSNFTEIFEEYGVEKVIYGHLHGPSLNHVFEGTYNGIEYIMTSCDYINFDPVKII